MATVAGTLIGQNPVDFTFDSTTYPGRSLEAIHPTRTDVLLATIPAVDITDAWLLSYDGTYAVSLVMDKNPANDTTSLYLVTAYEPVDDSAAERAKVSWRGTEDSGAFADQTEPQTLRESLSNVVDGLVDEVFFIRVVQGGTTKHMIANLESDGGGTGNAVVSLTSSVLALVRPITRPVASDAVLHTALVSGFGVVVYPTVDTPDYVDPDMTGANNSFKLAEITVIDDQVSDVSVRESDLDGFTDVVRVAKTVDGDGIATHTLYIKPSSYGVGGASDYAYAYASRSFVGADVTIRIVGRGSANPELLRMKLSVLSAPTFSADMVFGAGGVTHRRAGSSPYRYLLTTDQFAASASVARVSLADAITTSDAGSLPTDAGTDMWSSSFTQGAVGDGTVRLDMANEDATSFELAVAGTIGPFDGDTHFDMATLDAVGSITYTENGRTFVVTDKTDTETVFPLIDSVLPGITGSDGSIGVFEPAHVSESAMPSFRNASGAMEAAASYNTGTADTGERGLYVPSDGLVYVTDVDNSLGDFLTGVTLEGGYGAGTTSFVYQVSDTSITDLDTELEYTAAISAGVLGLSDLAVKDGQSYTSRDLDSVRSIVTTVSTNVETLDSDGEADGVNSLVFTLQLPILSAPSVTRQSALNPFQLENYEGHPVWSPLELGSRVFRHQATPWTGEWRMYEFPSDAASTDRVIYDMWTLSNPLSGSSVTGYGTEYQFQTFQFSDGTSVAGMGLDFIGSDGSFSTYVHDEEGAYVATVAVGVNRTGNLARRAVRLSENGRTFGGGSGDTIEAIVFDVISVTSAEITATGDYTTGGGSPPTLSVREDGSIAFDIEVVGGAGDYVVHAWSEKQVDGSVVRLTEVAGFAVDRINVNSADTANITVTAAALQAVTTAAEDGVTRFDDYGVGKITVEPASAWVGPNDGDYDSDVHAPLRSSEETDTSNALYVFRALDAPETITQPAGAGNPPNPFSARDAIRGTLIPADDLFRGGVVPVNSDGSLDYSSFSVDETETIGHTFRLAGQPTTGGVTVSDDAIANLYLELAGDDDESPPSINLTGTYIVGDIKLSKLVITTSSSAATPIEITDTDILTMTSSLTPYFDDDSQLNSIEVSDALPVMSNAASSSSVQTLTMTLYGGDADVAAEDDDQETPNKIYGFGDIEVWMLKVNSELTQDAMPDGTTDGGWELIRPGHITGDPDIQAIVTSTPFEPVAGKTREDDITETEWNALTLSEQLDLLRNRHDLSIALQSRRSESLGANTYRFVVRIPAVTSYDPSNITWSAVNSGMTEVRLRSARWFFSERSNPSVAATAITDSADQFQDHLRTDADYSTSVYDADILGKIRTNFLDPDTESATYVSGRAETLTHIDDIENHGRDILRRTDGTERLSILLPDDGTHYHYLALIVVNDDADKTLSTTSTDPITYEIYQHATIVLASDSEFGESSTVADVSEGGADLRGTTIDLAGITGQLDAKIIVTLGDTDTHSNGDRFALCLLDRTPSSGDVVNEFVVLRHDMRAVDLKKPVGVTLTPVLSGTTSDLLRLQAVVEYDNPGASDDTLGTGVDASVDLDMRVQVTIRGVGGGGAADWDHAVTILSRDKITTEQATNLLNGLPMRRLHGAGDEAPLSTTVPSSGAEATLVHYNKGMMTPGSNPAAGQFLRFRVFVRNFYDQRKAEAADEASSLTSGTFVSGEFSVYDDLVDPLLTVEPLMFSDWVTVQGPRYRIAATYEESGGAYGAGGLAPFPEETHDSELIESGNDSFAMVFVFLTSLLQT